MLIRPLPGALLCHSVVVKSLSGTDEWGRESYEERTLRRVRLEFEPGQSLEYARDRKRESLRAKLYVAGDNPGMDGGIKPDDLVLWKGWEFRVYGVTEHYGTGADRPHHYVIGLV